MTDQRKTALAKVLAFITAIIWGSSFFVVKNAVDAMPPAFLIAIRFTIGTLLLIMLFHKRLRGLNRRDVRGGIIIGALLYAAQYVQTLGIVDTTPGKNAFLTTVYCVLVPFVYWAVRRRRPAIKAFIAAAICLLGVGIVSLNEGFSIVGGDLLTLLSGLLFACHIVAIAVSGGKSDPIALSILQFATTAVLCWITGFCFEEFPVHIGADALWAVGFLAIFPTTLGFTFQIIAQRYASPESLALIFSLESVFALGFSMLFYGEQLTLRTGLGFITIFIAVLISEIRIDKEKLRGALLP